jgi:hypothetical protein
VVELYCKVTIEYNPTEGAHVSAGMKGVTPWCSPIGCCSEEGVRLSKYIRYNIFHTKFD